MRRAGRFLSGFAPRWLAAILLCLDGMREMSQASAEQAAHLTDIANGHQ